MMNPWHISIIPDDDEGAEIVRLELSSNDMPIPNIGETIWLPGKLSGNGYTVIDKHIAYDDHKITIVIGYE